MFTVKPGQPRNLHYLFLFILGGFGVDFSSDSDKLEQGLKTVSKCLLQHGVTSYCPTIVTSSQASYKEVNIIPYYSYIINLAIISRKPLFFPRIK